MAVDDNWLFLRSLQTILEELHHEVTLVADGALAWERYQDDPVRLVISDWMMPEMNGLELCRRIRRWREPGDYCYFILLTAHAGSAEYREAMDAGVDDFLSKPVNPQELLARIRVANRILTSTARIRKLESLLPICSYCKRIRDVGDRWVEFDQYLSKRAEADFSHGVCPDCFRRLDAIGPAAGSSPPPPRPD